MTYRYCPGCGVDMGAPYVMPMLCVECNNPTLEFKEKCTRLGKGTGIDREYPIGREDTPALKPTCPECDSTHIPCSECGGCIWQGNSYCRENHKLTCSCHEDYVSSKPDCQAELREKYNNKPEYCFTEGVIADINELLGMLEAPELDGRKKDYQRVVLQSVKLLGEIEQLKTKLDRERREWSRHNSQCKAIDKQMTEEIKDLKAKLEADPHEKERMRLSGVVLQQCYDIGKLKDKLDRVDDQDGIITELNEILAEVRAELDAKENTHQAHIDAYLCDRNIVPECAEMAAKIKNPTTEDK